MIKRRDLLILGSLMAGGFVVSEAWKPSKRLATSRDGFSLDRAFPPTFGSWSIEQSGIIQLISPDTEALLRSIYDQTLSRTYVQNGRNRVMLSVAYGGDQSDATRAHRPEVCYPAQGFQVSSNHEAAVSTTFGSLPVRRLVAQQGSRVEPITYWIVVGDKVALSGMQQKLAQLSYTTRGVIPDGILIRVSNIDTAGRESSFSLHDQFIRDMALRLHSEGFGRFVGEANRA